jgi:mono/diheme cytochrome c family protein
MRVRPALWVLILSLSIALPACRKGSHAEKSNPLDRAYDVEMDWNNPQRVIPLDYTQSQGKRLFYSDCVWCHADSTPAGPSNRSNVTPTPVLINNGSVLNPMSDDYLRRMIRLGGSAMGKSAMMPPWGWTLTQKDIGSIIDYMRAIADPPYKAPALPTSP